MSLPATEAFTDTDGVQLTTHSASWTLNSGDFDIQSNGFCIDDANNQLVRAAHWNADAFSNDQYSQAVATLITSSEYHYLGVSVRCAASANTFYAWIIPGNKVATAGAEYMIKMVDGSSTTLVSDGGTALFSNGDTLKFTAAGTTLTPYRNDSTTGTCGAQTDNAISSGYAGISGYDWNSGTRTLVRFDTWEGGNLAAESSSVSPSVSPSASLSPSASGSPSASESPSLSPSESASPSISPSASASPSIAAPPIVFGEENPTEGEEPVSWQTWSDGAGNIPTVSGDPDWGKLQLDLSGEEGRSRVYDLGSATSRKFTVTENRYGAGQNDATLQIRGDANTFDQDDVLPAWENYTVPITRSWRYVQIRETTLE